MEISSKANTIESIKVFALYLKITLSDEQACALQEHGIVFQAMDQAKRCDGL